MPPEPEIEDEEKSTPQQEARAKLRESFLKEVSELCGEACHILTYENSLLQAKFSGWNPNGSEVIVQDLKTPAHVEMATSLLRTPDILAIKFDRPLQLS